MQRRKSRAAATFPYVQEVARALRGRYGVPSLGNKPNPFNELLYIILSSKTPGHKYQRAYTALRRRFAKADDLATASVRTIEKTIRFAGLERKKAIQIRAIARALKEEFGRVTLRPLSKMSDSATERFLTSLPGVGLKSARCVLLYSLNRKVFPVDNHCYRIAKRLGWTKGSPWTKRVAENLQAGITSDLRKPLHVGLVLLGREYCLPKAPRCPKCPLLQYCPTGQRKVRSYEGR
jgi:endonuclease III